ncbi:MAG: rRNA maturation RNase YbeY [Pseudomonadota bacterium]
MTTVDLVIEDPRWEALPLPRLAEVGTRAALTAADAGEGYEIVLMACDDARIADLNAEFRDKSTPTNVLSWPAHDLAPLVAGEAPPAPPAPDGFDDALGDIALAYETCIREAREQGKPIEDHLTHLILHATLHLLGYDHTHAADAALMEGLERKALAQLGIPDPYS